MWGSFSGFVPPREGRQVGNAGTGGHRDRKMGKGKAGRSRDGTNG